MVTQLRDLLLLVSHDDCWILAEFHETTQVNQILKKPPLKVSQLCDNQTVYIQVFLHHSTPVHLKLNQPEFHHNPLWWKEVNECTALPE